MNRLKQIDAELADQIEELHLEMATRANETIAKHKEAVAEIEKEKAKLECQGPTPRNHSRGMLLEDNIGVPSSSSSYYSKKTPSFVGVSDNNAFASAAFASSSFEPQGIFQSSFKVSFPDGGSNWESAANPGPLRADSSY